MLQLILAGRPEAVWGVTRSLARGSDQEIKRQKWHASTIRPGEREPRGRLDDLPSQLLIRILELFLHSLTIQTFKLSPPLVR